MDHTAMIKNINEEDWTKHNKLNKFFKGDTCTKRIKALLAFEIGSNSEEQNAFYQRYFSDIYKCVLDSIQYYDYVFGKKEPVNLSEVIDVFIILTHLLHRVEIHIKRKWQARSIGMNAAILFIDILGKQTDQAIISAVANSLKFSTFAPNDSEELTKWYDTSLLAETPTLTFAISKSSPTMVDTLKLLDQLLTFIVEIPPVERFPFWFNILKTKVFPILYPRVCETLDIVKKEDKVPGFMHDCPHEIQELIVRWLSRCLRNSELALELCSTETHLRLVAEISRQTLNFQPDYPSYRESIHRVIEYYSDWILNEKSPYLTENIQIWLQTIIDQVSSMFYDLDFDEKSLKEKINACKEVINMYEQLASEAKWKLNTVTWERFLVTLLNITNFVVKTSELQKGGTANENMIEKELLNPLLDCLFNCFVRSGTMTTLWEELQDKLYGWMHRLPVVRRWKAKLIDLSKHLIEWLGIESEKSINEAKEKDNFNGQQVIDNMQIGFNEKFRLWDHFIRIAAHPCEIQDIDCREVVLDGLVSSLGKFVDAIQNPPPKPTRKEKIQAAQSGIPLRPPYPNRSMLPSANTLLKIFGPILFDIANSPDPDFITGRAVAYGALCRIFETRSPEGFDEIYLTTFYQLLHHGLNWHLERKPTPPTVLRMESQLSMSLLMNTNETDNYVIDPDEMEIQNELNATSSEDSIRWTILRHSPKLFQVDLHGINILIPDYLRAIAYELDPKAQSTTPKGIRRVCVSILSSWIALPYHYPNVTFKNLSKNVDIMNKDKWMKKEEKRLRKIRENRLRKQKDQEKGLDMMENPIFTLQKDDSTSVSPAPKLEIPSNIPENNETKDDIKNDNNNSTNWGTYARVWHELRFLLLQCANVDQIEDGNIVYKALWSLTVMLHLHLDAIEATNNEVNNNNIPLNADFVDDIIDVLLKATSTYDSKTLIEARSAIEALKVLAYVQQRMPVTIFTKVIKHLTKIANESILVVINHPEDQYVFNHGLIASEIIYCLLEWIMLSTSPSDFLSSQSNIVKKLFDVINLGLTSIHRIKIRLNVISKPAHIVYEDLKITEALRSALAKKGNVDANARFKELSRTHAPSNSDELPNIAALQEIYNACDTILSVLPCNSYHFPLPGDVGPEQISSNIHESSDDNFKQQIFLSLDDRHLVTVLQTTMSENNTKDHERSLNTINGEATCRLILRNKTGKYVWDFQTVDDSLIKNNIDKNTNKLLKPKTLELKTEKKVMESINKKSIQGPTSIPTPMINDNETIFHDNFDLLSQVYEHISKQDYVESLLSRDKDTIETDKKLVQELDEMMLSILSHSRQEEMSLENRTKEEEEIRQILYEQLIANQNMQYTKWSGATGLDTARALLVQLYLGLDANIYEDTSSGVLSRIHMLEDNERLKRNLKLLDGTPARECHKIGVLYVANGQENQMDILMNETIDATDAYQRFLSCLGDEVDITNHRGFLGGLDVRSTGDKSIYKATATCEIMFHVVTMMPTKSNDPQQISKKRQVGNDHVHIIYSDHYRDYLPSTISSQFNDAHIVVYPLKSGLYRIQVFQKAATVPAFGPLCDGMVVTESLLGHLVRLTALNANRNRRYSTQGYGRPLPTRQKYIDDAIKRSRLALSIDELFFNLFPVNIETQIKGAE